METLILLYRSRYAIKYCTKIIKSSVLISFTEFAGARRFRNDVTGWRVLSPKTFSERASGKRMGVSRVGGRKHSLRNSKYSFGVAISLKVELKNIQNVTKFKKYFTAQKYGLLEYYQNVPKSISRR